MLLLLLQDKHNLRQVNCYRCRLLQKILSDHVRTVSGNMHGKFEVRNYNRFKLV